MRYILWTAILAVLVSCAALSNSRDVITSTANERTSPGDLYRYRGELLITIDEKTFQGMAVTKLVGPLTIHVESKFELNRLQFSSCARQDVIRDFDSSWFSKSKTYDYKYVPNAVELGGECPLYIEAFSKAALTSWGFIAFRKDEALPARMDCNGVAWSFAGISVCQTKAGTIQGLRFEKPIVEMEADPGCGLVEKEKLLNYELRPKLGVCNATFYDGKDWHALYLFGYERVLVQGE